MSEHRATSNWQRESPDFNYDSCNRSHAWAFDGKEDVAVSAAPGYKGDPERVDPQEAYVASLSSCHMLTFLAIAAVKRFVVDQLTDESVG